MKTSLAFLIVFLPACASLNPKPEELKARPHCVVWKDGPLGSRHVVEPQENILSVPHSCFLLNMYMCKYTNYTVNGGKSLTISINDTQVAALEERRVTVPALVPKVDPFYLGETSAEYTIQGPIGPKQTMKVEFNDKCSVKQAALGVVALLSK